MRAHLDDKNERHIRQMVVYYNWDAVTDIIGFKEKGMYKKQIFLYNKSYLKRIQFEN